MVNTYIKQQDKAHKLAASLYTKNKGNGSMLPEVISSIKTEDDAVRARITKLLTSMDKHLYKKSNTMQKIIMNNILLTHVLKLRATLDVNLTAVISLLSYQTDNATWKRIVSKNIIPFLIKNKFI